MKRTLIMELGRILFRWDDELRVLKGTGSSVDSAIFEEISKFCERFNNGGL